MELHLHNQPLLLIQLTLPLPWRASAGHPNGTTTLTLTGTNITLPRVMYSVVTVDLPAGYLAADKSTWKHVFAARTGGNWEGRLRQPDYKLQ
jgi:hypothetical protein